MSAKIQKAIREEGETAKTANRPQFLALVEYCRKHRPAACIVRYGCKVLRHEKAAPGGAACFAIGLSALRFTSCLALRLISTALLLPPLVAAVEIRAHRESALEQSG